MHTTWNFDLLFRSDDDPMILETRAASEKATTVFVEKWKNRQDYLEDPKVLAEAMNEYSNWAECHGANAKECYYFWLKSELDQNNTTIKARLNQAQDIATKLENEIQFFSIRIAKIPAERQEQFLNYSGLEPYRHNLKGLFETAKYTLSEAEEKICNLKSQTAFSSWVQMLSGFLTKEEREVLLEDGTRAMKTESGLISLMKSQNKAVRDDAARALNEILAKFSEVAEHEINAVLGYKKVEDELRGFTRPDESRHISDDIDSSVVDALVESVTSRMDIMRRYYELKAKLLGLPRLAYHERNVEYGAIDKMYSYEESLDIVLRTFSRLDSEFGEIMQSFVAEGRIDAFPRV
jgi:oligoendopeptidase F